MGGEVDDDVEVGRVGDVAEAAAEVGEGGGQVLEQGGEGVGPRVRPHVDAEDFVAAFQQVEGQISTDLAAGAGD